MIAQISQSIRQIHSKIDSLEMIKDFTNKPEKNKAINLAQKVDAIFKETPLLREVFNDIELLINKEFNAKEFEQKYHESIEQKNNPEIYIAGSYIFLGANNGKHLLGKYAMELRPIWTLKDWTFIKSIINHTIIKYNLSSESISYHAQDIMKKIFINLKKMNDKEIQCLNQ